VYLGTAISGFGGGNQQVYVIEGKFQSIFKFI